jgi:hypothetical protein
MRSSAAFGAALALALVAGLLLNGVSLPTAGPATAAAPGEAPLSSGAGGASLDTVPAVPHPAQSPANAIWQRVCTGSAPYTCPNTPTARKNAALVDDVADGYILGFGGQTTVSAGVRNDSFYWSHGAWHVNPSGPSTLTIATNSSIAYDSTDGYVLLFGGWSGTSLTYRSFVFKYLAGTWTQLSPATKPAGRAGACMMNVPSYNGHGGYVLLFGGQAGAEWFSDTWEYVGGTWTNVTSTAGTPPSGRAYTACAYDAADHYGLLFGGTGGALGATPVNDTWEWNPTTSTWTQLIASGSTAGGSGPVKQFSDGMTYVTSLGEVVQQCGATGTFLAPSQQAGGCATYAWSGSTGKWTNISATVGFGTSGTSAPKPGYGSTLVDDGGTYALHYGGETPTAATSNATYAIGNLPVGNTTESLGEMVYNTTSTFYANVTGGSTPYSYSWTKLPTGCVSANTSSLHCNPTAAGVYSPWNVTVTTSDGYSTNLTGLSLTVDPFASVSAGLSSPSFVGTVNASRFWGTREYLASTMTNATFLRYLNETPYMSFIRWGASCDTSNYTAGLQYSNTGSSSPLVVSYGLLDQFLNETGDKWIFCVDGQENNAGMAASEVNYIENVVGMHPYYWSIGNEPGAWNHWNIPFASWTASQNQAPTPHEYAVEVQNYTKAMKGVDPNIRIIGIQAGAGALKDETWMYNLSKLDGPNISAAAFHNYGDARGTQVIPVNQFLLQYNTSLTYKAGIYDQQNLSAGCPTCKIPLFMDEFNSYLASSENPWQSGYPEVAYAGLGLAETLESGISQFMFFDFYDGWNLSLVNSTPANGLPRPAFALFTDVLGHLPLGRTYFVNATPTSTMWNLNTVASCSKTQCGVFIVNANTSVTAVVNPEGLGSSLGVCSTIYSMAEVPNAIMSTGSFTNVGCGGGLPASLTVPPMGVKLIVLNLVNLSTSLPGTIAPAIPAGLTDSSLLTIAAFGVGLLAALILAVALTSKPKRRTRRIGR